MPLEKEIKKWRKRLDMYEFKKPEPFWKRASRTALFIGSSFMLSFMIMKNFGNDPTQYNKEQQTQINSSEQIGKKEIINPTSENLKIRVIQETIIPPSEPLEMRSDLLGNMYCIFKGKEKERIVNVYDGIRFKPQTIMKRNDLIWGGVDREMFRYFYYANEVGANRIDYKKYNIYLLKNNKNGKKITHHKIVSEEYGYWNEKEELFHLLDGRSDSIGNNYIIALVNYKTNHSYVNRTLSIKTDNMGELINKKFVVPDVDRSSKLKIGNDNKLYVHSPNKSIHVFDNDWNYLNQIGSPNGNGDGQFMKPQDITIGPDGSVYIADTSNHRIQKFDPDGAFIAKFGEYGSGKGQFNYPARITVDKNSNVYVYDKGNNRIQKFRF